MDAIAVVVLLAGCVSAALIVGIVLWTDDARNVREEAEREEQKRTAEALRQAAREMRARRVEANTLADAIRSGRDR